MFRLKFCVGFCLRAIYVFEAVRFPFVPDSVFIFVRHFFFSPKSSIVYFACHTNTNTKRKKYQCAVQSHSLIRIMKRFLVFSLVTHTHRHSLANKKIINSLNWICTVIFDKISFKNLFSLNFCGYFFVETGKCFALLKHFLLSVFQ